MVSGFGRGLARGFGSGRGMGFGFRGSSPPWPYVGRGRGGLPRCGYFLSGAAGTPSAQPFTPKMTREQELGFLREQLEQIEARMRDLESEK